MGSIKKYKNVSYRYYDIGGLKKYKANINLIASGRSDGKTFSALTEIALKEYIKSKHKDKFIYIRRQREDFTRGRGGFVFSGVNNEGKVKELTGSKWEKVIYRNSSFYLAKYDEELQTDVLDTEPFGYAVPLSESYHLKSSNFDTVKNVIFDEFISPVHIGYLVDEWIIWQNLQSTIIRQRDDVTFWLLGNTLDYIDNPYFIEMGLDRIIEDMRAGDTYILETDNGLKIALELPLVKEKSRLSDKFFSFSNSTNENMITNGEWSYTEFKHLPYGFKLKNCNKLASIYLDYKDRLLNIDFLTVYSDENKSEYLDLIVYVHDKTTPLKFKREDIILTDKVDSIKYNIVNDISTSNLKICKLLNSLIKEDKIYYQDNKIGSIFYSFYTR